MHFLIRNANFIHSSFSEKDGDVTPSIIQLKEANYVTSLMEGHNEIINDDENSFLNETSPTNQH